MKNVFFAAWDAMDRYCINHDDVEMAASKREAYADKCHLLYKNFKKGYMKKDSETLDRHKIAGIIAVVASSGEYIKCTKAIDESQFFLGRYTIPLVISLSYIEQEFNKDLKKFKLLPKGKDIALYIPKPSACTTEYIDSLGRSLYFEERANSENPVRVIELANTFFLIEECTLLKNNIDTDKWVKLKRQSEC